MAHHFHKSYVSLFRIADIDGNIHGCGSELTRPSGKRESIILFFDDEEYEIKEENFMKTIEVWFNEQFTDWTKSPREYGISGYSFMPYYAAFTFINGAWKKLGINRWKIEPFEQQGTHLLGWRITRYFPDSPSALTPLATFYDKKENPGEAENMARKVCRKNNMRLHAYYMKHLSAKKESI